jgi:hypothetical protein
MQTFEYCYLTVETPPSDRWAMDPIGGLQRKWRVEKTYMQRLDELAAEGSLRRARTERLRTRGTAPDTPPRGQPQ